MNSRFIGEPHIRNFMDALVENFRYTSSESMKIEAVVVLCCTYCMIGSCTTTGWCNKTGFSHDCDKHFCFYLRRPNGRNSQRLMRVTKCCFTSLFVVRLCIYKLNKTSKTYKFCSFSMDMLSMYYTAVHSTCYWCTTSSSARCGLLISLRVWIES